MLGQPARTWADFPSVGLADGKWFPQESRFGLYLPHDFRKDNAHCFDDDIVEAGRSKFRHLARRWETVMADNGPVLFLWQNTQSDLRLYVPQGQAFDDVFGMTEDRRVRLADALGRARGGRPFVLLTVSPGPDVLAKVAPNLYHAGMSNMGSEWWGHDPSWDVLLRVFGKLVG